MKRRDVIRHLAENGCEFPRESEPYDLRKPGEDFTHPPMIDDGGLNYRKLIMKSLLQGRERSLPVS